MPALGGSVTRFGQHRPEGFRHWFRPATPEAMGAGSGQHAACFPLVPVSGRIAEARLRFRGRIHETPRNVPSERNHLHGEGWQASWSVTEASPDAITLGLSGPVAGWPFPYDAALRYVVRPEGLVASLTLTNTGPDDMPGGIGFHPWFTEPSAVLVADARTVFEIDGDKLFKHQCPVPEHWDFAAGRVLAKSDLEHGFADWDGRAALRWPGRPGRLMIRSSDTLRHLVIYTRDASGDFCVEPVSHSVDGFNLHAQGVPNTGTVVIAPGGSLTGSISFFVED